MQNFYLLREYEMKPLRYSNTTYVQDKTSLVPFIDEYNKIGPYRHISTPLKIVRSQLRQLEIEVKNLNQQNEKP